MDLKDFVSETLLQIVEGVRIAQAQAQDHGAEIDFHPDKYVTDAGKLVKLGLLPTGLGKVVQFVQFDIALTVKEGTGTKGGIGVFAGPISLGSIGQSSAENASVNRVKFLVPLALSRLAGSKS